MLREQLGRYGVLGIWEGVIRPMLAAIGEQWPDVPGGIAVEHLVSHLATVTLGEVAQRTAPAGDRTLLLARAPGEMHDVPLTALAAAFDVTRVSPVVLGARTPASALVEAVDALRPSVVVLLALLPGCAWGELFDLLDGGGVVATIVTGAGSGLGAEFARHLGEPDAGCSLRRTGIARHPRHGVGQQRGVRYPQTRSTTKTRPPA